MCKYCEECTKEPIIEEIETDYEMARIENGVSIYETSMHTYAEGDYKSASIDIWHSVRLDDGAEYVVKEHNIKINYCPFCGRKLV